MPTAQKNRAVCDLEALWSNGVLGPLDDAVLLARFNTSDHALCEAAFAVLVARHGSMVLRVCESVLRDHHDAQDAAQATFLILARYARSIRDTRSLGPWLHRVALRVARRARKVDARRKHLEQQAAQKREEAMNQEPPLSCPELHAELNRLSNRFRLPIVLCDLDGLTQEQAARALDWPLGTLQSRLHRGRQKLRDRLMRHGTSAVLALTHVHLPNPVWIERTSHAATLLARGGHWTSAVSPAVAALTQGSMHMIIHGTLRSVCIATVSLLVASGLTAGAWNLAFVGNNKAEPARGIVKKPSGPQSRRGELQTPKPARQLGEFVVRGVVVDEAGKPVPGAQVRLEWHGQGEAATTNAEGGFEIHLAHTGPSGWFRNFAAWAEADDGRRLGWVGDVPADEAKAGVRIVLKPAHEVRVSVVDEQGRSVAGAQVEAVNFHNPQAATTSDDQGQATLRLPESMPLYWIVAKKAGVGFDYYENLDGSYHERGVVPRPQPNAIRLILDGARRVPVKVVDREGKPVADAVVYALLLNKKGKIDTANLSGARLSKELTGPDGIAHFDWIPTALREGDGVMFKLGLGPYYSGQDVVFRPEQPETPLVIEAARRSLVAGRVVLPDGNPAPGIAIEAAGFGQAGANDSWNEVTTTQADGTYVLDLPSNLRYIIAIVDDQWAAPAHVGMAIPDGANVSDLNFRLVRPTTIEGRVLLADTEEPLPQQTVILHQLGLELPVGSQSGNFDNRERLMRWAKTDANGHYAFQVGPGEYQIFFYDNNHSYESKIPHRREFKVVDEKALTVDLAATRVREPEQRRIKGLVLDTEGRPFAGALISAAVARPNTRIIERPLAVSDANGRFTLRELSGFNVLVAAKTRDDALAGAVDVSAHEAGDITIRLAPSVTISGRIVGTDGKPAVGGQVVVGWGMSPVQKREEQLPMWKYLYADMEGRYRVDGLPVEAVVFVGGTEHTGYTRSEELDLTQAGAVEVPDIKLRDSPRVRE